MNDNTYTTSLEDHSTFAMIKKVLYLTIKRIFDIFCSILGITLMVPVVFIVKICYVCTGDFHSIFYRQARVGKNGKMIGIYKFRSMVHDADKQLKELISKEPYKTEWKLNHKIENDPRITKIGNLLRKTSLDELPQFINVDCRQCYCGI